MVRSRGISCKMVLGMGKLMAELYVRNDGGSLIYKFYGL
jgi:hypothetical protein